LKKKLLVILCIAAMLATVGIVYGAYVMTSNTVTINPATQFTLTLVANSTTPILGVDTVRLTATCNDPTFAGSITFGALGSVTAVNGVAIKDYTPVNSTPIVVTATAPHS
jgi:hypothetical protein